MDQALLLEEKNRALGKAGIMNSKRKNGERRQRANLLVVSLSGRDEALRKAQAT